jgi:Bacteriocin-protection, YdeI or OmpD-Associated
MTGWVSFEGRVEPLVWGRSTYTILRLPTDAVTVLVAQGAKRVEGEMNDHPVNLALTRAPDVDGVFLWTGLSLMDQVGIELGEMIEVRLRPAPDDAVETPGDVDLALRAADALEFWDALTPGKRRGLLYQVNTAKTAPTRAKRIAALMTMLTGGRS